MITRVAGLLIGPRIANIATHVNAKIATASPCVLRNSAGMNVKEWIQALVDRHPDKSLAGIGRALGRDKSIGSKILKGARQVQADEIPVIAAYFGEPPLPA